MDEDFRVFLRREDEDKVGILVNNQRLLILISELVLEVLV